MDQNDISGSPGPDKNMQTCVCLRLTEISLQMGTHSVTVWSTFLESIFRHVSGTPFCRDFEKTGPQNDTETESLFETLDLAKM